MASRRLGGDLVVDEADEVVEARTDDAALGDARHHGLGYAADDLWGLVPGNVAAERFDVLGGRTLADPGVDDFGLVVNLVVLDQTNRGEPVDRFERGALVAATVPDGLDGGFVGFEILHGDRSARAAGDLFQEVVHVVGLLHRGGE